MNKLKKFIGSLLLISILSACAPSGHLLNAAEPKATAFFDPTSLGVESAPSPFASDKERLDQIKLERQGVDALDSDLLAKIETARNRANDKAVIQGIFDDVLEKDEQHELKKDTLEQKQSTSIRQLAASSSLVSRLVQKVRDVTQTKMQQRLKNREDVLKATVKSESVLDSLKEANELLQDNLDAELELILSPEEKALVGEVEADYLYSLEGSETFPNDPEVNNQWEIGAVLSQFSSHFDTPASSSERIVVAIIDSGVDYSHEDLVGHIYNPVTCFDENGTTTPNGCPYGGWDYVDDDNDPMPNSGETHGTQIAGLIGAQNDSNLGIASLSNNLVDIMPIRVTDGGYIELSNIIDAIYFAVENGADVINMSFTGPTYSSTLEDAIEYAENNGVIVVTAAGNYGLDIDSTPTYPASYDFENVIAVSALNADNTLASFSNYGDQTVDFAAPGVELVTTNINDGYSVVNGSSFSAAIASAMAGALLAQGSDPLSVFAGLDESPSLAQQTIDGRVLGAAVDLPPTVPYSLPQLNATATDPTYGDYYIQAKGGMNVASGTYELSYDNLNPYLAAPTTYYPGNTSASSYMLLYGNKFIFNWSAVSGAFAYGLYIRDLNTGQLVYDVDNGIVGSVWTIKDIFTPGHKYRWNMRSYDSKGDRSAFSGYRFFEIASAPTKPVTSSPGSTSAPGSSYVSTSQTFSWSDTGADYYELNVRDTTTNTFIRDEFEVSGTSHQVTTLVSGHTYKWDVRACYDSPGGCSGYATDRYFTIGAVNGAPNVPGAYGNTSVLRNVSYDLTLYHYHDPNGDSVKFYVDWGDGSATASSSSYIPINTPHVMSHTYTATGTPCIKARSYDGDDYSPWSSCKYVSVTQGSSGPDLVGRLETSNDSLSASAYTTVDFEVENIGGSTATNDFEIDFYLSRDSNISAAHDQWLGTYSTTTNISASGEISAVKGFVLPDAGHSSYYGDGEYFIGMVVDAQNDVAEASETNNAGRGIGIDIQTIYVNGTQSGGLRFDVSNISTQAAGQNFTVTVNTTPSNFSGNLQLTSALGKPSKQFIVISNGYGQQTISLDTPGANRLYVSGGSVAGTSNYFNVTGTHDDGNAHLKITDKRGEVLANVPVTITCASSQSTCSTSPETESSNANGIVSFDGKYAGKYRLTINYDGHVTVKEITIGASFGSVFSIDIPIPSNDNYNPVILIPGLGGSTEGSWFDHILPFIQSPLDSDGRNANKLSISDRAWEPGLGKFTQGWGKIKEVLTSDDFGYSEDSIIDCPWDWRKPADVAVDHYLLDCIEKAKNGNQNTKVDIIAHSMGGLVARAYIQSDRYNNDVGKVAFIGAPHEGGSTAYPLWMGRPYEKGHADLTENQIKLQNENELSKYYKQESYNNIEQLVNNTVFVRNFIRDNAKSVKDMLPTYPFLETFLGSLPLIVNENKFLKALNGESCSGGCGYDYVAPEERFGNATNTVLAKDFINSSINTVQKFDISLPKNIEDGFPILQLQDPNKHYEYKNIHGASGDGTVTTPSALWLTEDNDIGAPDKFDVSNNSAKHYILMNYMMIDLGEFLTGLSVTPSSYELEALLNENPVLSLHLTGAQQPLLTTPDGIQVGIGADGNLVDTSNSGARFEITNDGSSFSFESPDSGEYSLELHGAYENNYSFAIAYGNEDRTEDYLYDVIYDGSTTTINFTIDTNVAPDAPALTFVSAGDVPQNLTATKQGTSTQLSWQSPNDATPTSYRIYSRQVDDSTLQYKSQVSTTTYATGNVWAGASTTLMKRYQVSAVYANGEESFLSNAVYNNDEDQDGLPDHLELEEGTSTSTPDSDNDGLTDGEEYFNYGTDPTLADTDGDGIGDYDEVASGGTGTTPATAAQIYVDKLENGWEEYGSYGSVVNYQSTANIAQGTKAIQIATNGTWGGMWIRNNEGYDTTGYGTFKFAFHPGNLTNHVPRIRFYDENHKATFGDDINITSYITENISGGMESKWYNVEIPLAAIGIVDEVIADILVITSNTATFHLDNMHFAASAPTETVLYDDQLQNGWTESGSWSVTTNLSYSSTTYSSSSDAISLTYSTPWSGMALTTSNVLNGPEHEDFHIAYNPGSVGGQTDYIMLRDENSLNLNSGYVSFDDYISGTPQTNTWYSLKIPLVDLGASTSTIKDMIILGSASTTIFLDDIYLTKPTSTSTGSTSPSGLVFTEGLVSPWQDGGDWRTTTTFNSGEAHTGSKGLEVAYDDPWAGNVLSAGTLIDTSNFDTFYLAYNPGATTSQTLYTKLRDGDAVDYASYISLADYIDGTQQIDTWYELAIPFTDLGLTPGDLVKDIIFTTSGTSTIYFDDMKFAASSTPPSGDQSATNVAVYTDMFLNSWTHGGSWLATTSYTSATRTMGVYGIESEFTNGQWSDTAFNAATSVDTTNFDSLHIAYNPGATTSHTVYLKTQDENGTDHGSPVTLNSYITSMAANTWYNLVVPLVDLGISVGELVKNIIFISHDGPKVYFDDVYFGEPNTGGSDAFTEGMVSFTFDDGWLSQYTDALSILDAEGIDGTFYIVTSETLEATDLPQLLSNPSLESGSSAPDDWQFNSWGTNNASSSYPVSGVEGTDAARVEISSYTDGDAKWYSDDVNVYQDNAYTVSYQYRSNVTNDLVIRYTMQDDSYQYVTATSNPSNTSWTNTSVTVTTPQNVKSMAVFPVLAAVGYLEVDDFSVTRNQVYVDQDQVLELEAAGHEIGGHTRTHPALTQVSSAIQESEIEGSRTDLLSEMGVASVVSFAYPYGDYNNTVQAVAQSAGYTNARSTDPGFNYPNTNKYALKMQQIERDTTLSDVEEWIQTAKQDKTWLILMFHQIDDISHHSLGMSPELLGDVVDYVVADGINTVTVSEGVGLME